MVKPELSTPAPLSVCSPRIPASAAVALPAPSRWVSTSRGPGIGSCLGGGYPEPDLRPPAPAATGAFVSPWSAAGLSFNLPPFLLEFSPWSRHTVGLFHL